MLGLWVPAWLSMVVDPASSAAYVQVNLDVAVTFAVVCSVDWPLEGRLID